MYGERLTRWDRVMAWPLMAAAVVFPIADATQMLARERARRPASLKLRAGIAEMKEMLRSLPGAAKVPELAAAAAES
jgi:hypothetical protein